MDGSKEQWIAYSLKCNEKSSLRGLKCLLCMGCNENRKKIQRMDQEFCDKKF